jgi:hypothetical protein
MKSLKFREYMSMYMRKETWSFGIIYSVSIELLVNLKEIGFCIELR